MVNSFLIAKRTNARVCSANCLSDLKASYGNKNRTNEKKIFIKLGRKKMWVERETEGKGKQTRRDRHTTPSLN